GTPAEAAPPAGGGRQADTGDQSAPPADPVDGRPGGAARRARAPGRSRPAAARSGAHRRGRSGARSGRLRAPTGVGAGARAEADRLTGPAGPLSPMPAGRSG